MKTKLLRKVRKRYQILWYPNGTERIPFPCYTIAGINNPTIDWGEITVFLNKGKIIKGLLHQRGTEVECYQLIINVLKNYILRQYSQYGVRRNKKKKLFYKPEKVWYNGK